MQCFKDFINSFSVQILVRWILTIWKSFIWKFCWIFSWVCRGSQRWVQVSMTSRASRSRRTTTRHADNFKAEPGRSHGTFSHGHPRKTKKQDWLSGIRNMDENGAWFEKVWKAEKCTDLQYRWMQDIHAHIFSIYYRMMMHVEIQTCLVEQRQFLLHCRVCLLKRVRLGVSVCVCVCGNRYNQRLAVHFDILTTSRGCQGYTLDWHQRRRRCVSVISEGDAFLTYLRNWLKLLLKLLSFTFAASILQAA